MPLPVYSLGTFIFVNFSANGNDDGEPMLPQEHSEIIQRPNVRGSGIVRLERKGMPFEMRSMVDVDDETAAALLIGNYYLAVGTDPLEIVWRDRNYFTTYGVKYYVLSVQATQSRRVATAVGGSTAGLYVVRATWHLLPVEVQN